MRKLLSTHSVVVLTAVFALVMLGVPSAQAQLAGLSDGDTYTDDYTLYEDGNDEICDEFNNDELGDLILDCELTRAVVDLDGVIPTITFFGEFCETPEVSVGQSDGTYAPVLVLSSGPNFVTVESVRSLDYGPGAWWRQRLRPRPSS